MLKTTETVSPVSAVAPASVQVEPCSTVSVPLVTVITGAVMSEAVILNGVSEPKSDELYEVNAI